MNTFLLCLLSSIVSAAITVAWCSHRIAVMPVCGPEPKAVLYLAIHERDALHCQYLPTAEAYGRVIKRKTITKENKQ